MAFHILVFIQPQEASSVTELYGHWVHSPYSRERLVSIGCVYVILVKSHIKQPEITGMGMGGLWDVTASLNVDMY